MGFLNLIKKIFSSKSEPMAEETLQPLNEVVKNDNSMELLKDVSVNELEKVEEVVVEKPKKTKPKKSSDEKSTKDTKKSDKKKKS